MYIIIYAKDDTPAGRVDISELLARGFTLRIMDTSGRGRVDRAAEKAFHDVLNLGRAHEETLREAVELSLVEILKLIAADATKIPSSTNFRVPEDLITQARDAIAKGGP